MSNRNKTGKATTLLLIILRLKPRLYPLLLTSFSLIPVPKPKDTLKREVSPSGTLLVEASGTETLYSTIEEIIENSIAKNKYILVPGLNLPLIGAPGVPWFQGSNISVFLEQYTDMYKDYHVSDNTKRERIVCYISPIYKDQIKAMPEYCTDNPGDYQETKFFEALLKEFREYNWEILKISHDFLNRIIIQAQNRRISSKSYIDMFNRVSKELLKRKEMDEIT
jgi:hypothetical protein